VQAVPDLRWRALCQDCGGAIASLVELLQGRFSQGVMARLCCQGAGLFPAPAEITLSCSCPDGAVMCKHVAAVLYGIGARLDAEPELLFRLRRVDGAELLAQAASGLTLAAPAPAAERVLADDDLAELFGLEMGSAPAAPATPPKAKRVAPPKAKRVAPPKAKQVAALKAKQVATPKAKAGPKPKTKVKARSGVLR